jgi:prepilin peptidase CpaA
MKRMRFFYYTTKLVANSLLVVILRAKGNAMSVIVVYLIFSMLAVLWFDSTSYIIPNWLVGLLLLTYPVAVYMAPHAVDWKMATAGMGVVFVVGYIIFAMKWMGGGDIKLMTVLSLWVGLRALPDFIFIVALIGGVFAVGVWVIRKALPYLPKKPDSAPLPRILRDNEPIPYGIAIAFTFLLLMWMGKIPALAIS